jgi:TAF6 C-terminal HEAT repeat domain
MSLKLDCGAGANHWALREQAARCIAALAARFPQPQLGLLPRISSVCIGTLLNPAKALSSHYGAIHGLAAMGPRATRLLLLPRLSEYYMRLVPVLQQACPRKVSELCTAAGAALFALSADVALSFELRPCNVGGRACYAEQWPACRLQK